MCSRLLAGTSLGIFYSEFWTCRLHAAVPLCFVTFLLLPNEPPQEDSQCVWYYDYLCCMYYVFLQNEFHNKSSTTFRASVSCNFLPLIFAFASTVIKLEYADYEKKRKKQGLTNVAANCLPLWILKRD